MPLTDTQVRNAKPKSTPFKLADGEGMYLLVQPNGAKYWRLKYRHGGKEKVLALGIYPEVRLPDARQRRADAKASLAAKRDPGFERKTEKMVAAFRASNTFEGVAREWWEVQRSGWSESHAKGTLQRLEKQLFPALSGRPIAEIEAPELLCVLHIIEARGALELTAKTLITAGQVFRYAIATSRAKSDPTRDLRGALKRREVRHYNALKEADLPEFLKKLDTYDGHVLTQLATRLLMLTFLRTNELRAAYHRSQYPDERRRMLQGWADYLDGMASGAKVIPLRSKIA